MGWSGFPSGKGHGSHAAFVLLNPPRRLDRPAIPHPSKEHFFHPARPWRRLLALYSPERRLLGLSTVLWLVRSSPFWVLPILTANVIEIVSAPAVHPLRALWWNAACGTVFIGQHLVTHGWHYRTLSRAVRRIEARLRLAVCRQLHLLSLSYHKHTHGGALQSKVMQDVENIGLTLHELYSNGLYALCTVLITLAVVACRVPAFVPLLLLTTPAAAGLHHCLRGRLGETSHRFRRAGESLSVHLRGMLDMIPVTRAHAAEEDELARAEWYVRRVEEAGLRLDRQYGEANAAAWVVFAEFGLLGLVFTAWLSYRRILPLTSGDVVLLGGYFAVLTTVLAGFLNMLSVAARGLESLHSLDEVLACGDLEVRGGKIRLPEVRGAFLFQNVSFAYSGQETGRLALTDFSLRVDPGEKVGIVGASGAGKSTLLGLLLGFHVPTQGCLQLDGTDLRTVDLTSFRRQIAVVSQETLLFAGTVRENILHGIRDVTEARLLAAVQDANAAEFIARLPQGLDTSLGERGARLSGGERQRLAIARALIRSPRVLILDEATSALDVESEALVQEALNRLMLGRTTFIVAHRLSSLRQAEKIVVLKAGQLVELGALADLLSRPDGEFSRLQAHVFECVDRLRPTVPSCPLRFRQWPMDQREVAADVRP